MTAPAPTGNPLRFAIMEMELALISMRAAADANTATGALDWIAEGNAELARASKHLDAAKSEAWASHASPRRLVAVE